MIPVLATEDGASASVIKDQFDRQNLEKQLCAMASHEQYDINIYSRQAQFIQGKHSLLLL
jgi:hypothetical protein